MNDPGFNADFDKPNLFSATPLWIACEKGHKKVVEILLERARTIDTKHKVLVGGQEKTPKQIAKDKGHKEIVNLFKKDKNK